MIKRIIFAGILLCLFIAIPLALLGYKKVELGEPFLAFMRNVNNDLSQYKVEIPDIPSIPIFENADGFLIVLNVLIKICNFFVFILNAISGVLNVVIQLLEGIFFIVKNLISFGKSIQDSNSVPVV